MSFAHNLHKILDPFPRKTFLGQQDIAGDIIDNPKTPPAAPGVPNPNDAANAAQSLTDSMRMRRGMLSNIYAGANPQAAVTGKTQLGA
jgi:hypothetical protein